MPNELVIPAVPAITSSPDPPSSAERAAAARRPDRAPAPSPYVNPSLRLDPELGLVVIEFRDGNGALTATIPSERQIEAYRAYQDAHPKVTSQGDEPVAGATAAPALPSGHPAPSPPPAAPRSEAAERGGARPAPGPTRLGAAAAESVARS